MSRNKTISTSIKSNLYLANDQSVMETKRNKPSSTTLYYDTNVPNHLLLLIMKHDEENFMQNILMLEKHYLQWLFPHNPLTCAATLIG